MARESAVGDPLAPLRREVRRLARRSEETTRLHRLCLVLLLEAGVAPRDAARWFGTGERTLRRWRAVYRSDGAAALARLPVTGRPCRLAPAQRRALARDLASPPARFGYGAPAWTGALVQDWLQVRFRVRLSLRQCQRLLRALAAGP